MSALLLPVEHGRNVLMRHYGHGIICSYRFNWPEMCVTIDEIINLLLLYVHDYVSCFVFVFYFELRSAKVSSKKSYLLSCVVNYRNALSTIAYMLTKRLICLSRSVPILLFAAGI